MFKIKKTQIRSNASIPFFHETFTVSEEYRQHLQATYKNKLLSSNKHLSEDTLSLIHILEWSSRDDFLEYISDEYCVVNMIEPNQRYNEIAGIQSELEILEDSE